MAPFWESAMKAIVGRLESLRNPLYCRREISNPKTNV